MKRYERIFIISALMMLISAFGIVGAFDMQMEVSTNSMMTFIISTIVCTMMLQIKKIDK